MEEEGYKAVKASLLGVFAAHALLLAFTLKLKMGAALRQEAEGGNKGACVCMGGGSLRQEAGGGNGVCGGGALWQDANGGTKSRSVCLRGGKALVVLVI